MMRRILIKVLISVLCISILNWFPVKAEYYEKKVPNKELTAEQIEFNVLFKKHNTAMNSNNFMHTVLANKLLNDGVASFSMSAADKIAGFGFVPHRDDYIQTLVTVFTLFDRVDAFHTKAQSESDHLKDLKSYLVDGADIAAGLIGVNNVFSSTKAALPELSDAIGTAITALDATIGVVDKKIDTYLMLDAMLQDYSAYRDVLLILISNPFDDELKEAATLMLTAIDKGVEAELTLLSEKGKENVDQLSEYVFTDFFWEILRYTEEYEKNEAFRLFADWGSTLVGMITSAVTGASLGTALAKVFGNLLFGTEDSLRGFTECVALRNIVGSIDRSSVFNDIYKSVMTNPEKESFKRFEKLQKFTITCRSRGEYVIYRISCNDGRLLTLWNSKNNNEMENKYHQQEQWLEDFYNLLTEFVTTKDKNLEELVNSYWYFSAHVPLFFKFYEDGTFSTYSVHAYIDFSVSTEISPNAIGEKGGSYGTYSFENNTLKLDMHNIYDASDTSTIILDRYDYSIDGNIVGNVFSIIDGYIGKTYYYQTTWDNADSAYPMYMLKTTVKQSASQNLSEEEYYLSAWKSCANDHVGCEVFGKTEHDSYFWDKHFQYDVYDIDKNGTAEFIFRSAYPYGDREIWSYQSICTLNPENIPIVVNYQYIERGYMKIYDNSFIVVGGSGGAAYHDDTIYRYNNGVLLQIKHYGTDESTYENYPSTPFYTSDNEYLSYDEVNSDIARIIESGKEISINWKELSK